MKKLFALVACLLCAAMLATVGFAADAPDAYSLYKRASKSLDSAESVEMSGIVKTTMQVEGVALGEVSQNTLMRMITPADGNIQMEMRSAIKSTNAGTSELSTAVIYYKDGYMYTKTGDQTSKIKLDLEAAASQAGSFDTEITRSAFKDATVLEADDGTRVNFRINASDMKEVSSLLGDMGGLTDSDVAFSDIAYSMLIGPDGSLDSYDISFDMDMTIEGVTVHTQSIASYEILSINKVGAIDFPAGLAAY